LTVADGIVAAGEADRTPDWRVWQPQCVPEPKLWECVALWMDIDPRKVNISRYRVTEDLRYGDPVFEESREFDERLYIASESLHRTLRCTAINQYSLLESRVSLRQFAAWAREIGRDAPAELLAMADEPVAVKADIGRAANEPIAKRKASDTFIAALIRLIVEISKRAAENGMPFYVTEMPGTKADFRALAIKFDDNLDKAERTFDDYLAGLVRFKQGARETTYYQELFPELFKS
jgi:hypothetical protein